MNEEEEINKILKQCKIGEEFQDIDEPIPVIDMRRAIRLALKRGKEIARG